MRESRTIGTTIVGFILGVLASLGVAYVLADTSDVDELRRLREEKRLLQELVAEQKAQLEDINAVLEPPMHEPPQP